MAPTSDPIAEGLLRALATHELDALGLESGAWQRLRTITPHRLVRCLLAAMSGGRVETIADLCRSFNGMFGEQVRYKAFYNRLARAEFAVFMKAVVQRLLGMFQVRVLAAERGADIAGFNDIVVHDGSSFALKDALADHFPGRFFNRDPAAVEFHATFSGFLDEALAIALAPDTTHERAFLPDPQSLRGCLFLADRGYPSRPYFRALREAGARFVVRLSRAWRPRVRGDWPSDEAPTVQQFLEDQGDGAHDLDVEFRDKDKADVFRLVVRPSASGAGVWLCTNLERDRFSPEAVTKLYRFRWQIELLFKEWKSYANLRKFDTANPHIAEGLIWASLGAALLKRFLAHSTQAATGTPISTRKVAMCSQPWVRGLLNTLET